MNEQTVLILRRVLVTLDKIPVTGKEHLDHMLGAMLAIEQVINEAEAVEIVDEEETTND